MPFAAGRALACSSRNIINICCVGPPRWPGFKDMILLRSVAFAVIFYIGSLFYVLLATAALPLGRKAVVAIARQWGWFHRFCVRSEEHTSELQSLMRISYAVFCLKKKKQTSIYYIM